MFSNLRAKMRKNIQNACEKDEGINYILKSHTKTEAGRPRLEANQPALLSTILDVGFFFICQ